MYFSLYVTIVSQFCDFVKRQSEKYITLGKMHKITGSSSCNVIYLSPLESTIIIFNAFVTVPMFLADFCDRALDIH